MANPFYDIENKPMITPRDIVLGILVVAIWALHTVVIKMILIELEPVTALAIRLILTSIIFIPFYRWPGREKFKILLQISFLMAVLHWGTLFWSLERLDASTAVIIMQTQIIFSIGWGILLFGERIGWRSGMGVLLGIFGVVILVGIPENPPSISGVIVLIFSMIFVSLCYARMKVLEGVSILNYLAHLNLLSLLPIIGLAFLMEEPLIYDWEGVDYSYLILPFIFQIGIVSASHILWQRLLTRNDMSILPNLILLMPFLGIVFAMLILGETITWTMVFGGLLTTAGVGIILVRKSQKTKVKTQ
ncbi:MAG: DMT family transporter [Alphaproteobacteria bacterium]